MNSNARIGKNRGFSGMKIFGLVLFLFSLNFVFAADAAIDNIDIDVGSFAFDSANYVAVGNYTFNLTEIDDLIFKGAFSVAKFTNKYDTDLSMKINLNGVTAFDEVLRTVKDEEDVGIVAIPFFKSTGILGNNTVEIYVKEDGKGSLNITNFKLLISTNQTNLNSEIRNNISEIDTTFSNLNFVSIANITVNKTVNSSTLFDIHHTVRATGKTTVTCYIQNFDTSEQSPYYQRWIEDDEDIGSSGINYIAENKTLSNETWGLFCKNTDGKTVTNNLTILNLDLSDASANDVNYFQLTNQSTNVTNFLSFSAGTHKLLSYVNHTLRSGNEIELSATVIMGTSSGAHIPQFKINSTDAPEENCSVTYSRYLESNYDIGTAKFYLNCDHGLTLGNNYSFDLWVIVPSGETTKILDESLSAFNTQLFNITTNHIPPVPGAITFPASDYINTAGIENITWTSFFDIAGQNITYNVSLYNSDNTFNQTINTSTNFTYQEFNFSILNNDENWLIYVEGCDTDSLCTNTSTNFSIDRITPTSIEFVSPTTASGNYSQSNIVVNVTAVDSNIENITIYLYNSTGLVNSSMTGSSPNYINFTSLNDGTYYFNASVNDGAGNENSTSTRTIVLDTVLPSSVTNLNNQSATSTNIYWNWTNPVSDFSEAIIYIDGVWKVNTSNNYYNATGLSLGTNYTITVHVKDYSGNVNDTDVNDSAITLSTPDVTAPVITIASPLNTTYYSTTNISLNVSANEGINAWWYTNDSGVTNTTFIPNTTVLGVEGSNTFIIYGNDSSGNIGSSTVTFIIDLVSPIITLISPANGSTVTASPTVTFNYNITDAFPIANCSLIINDAINSTDTTITNATTQSFSVTLANADYNWSVNCSDNAGNKNSTEIRVFTLSYVAPVAPVSTGGTGIGSIMLCNWSCTPFSDCVAGVQTRICTNVIVGNCLQNAGRPVESQFCTIAPVAPAGILNAELTLENPLISDYTALTGFVAIEPVDLTAFIEMLNLSLSPVSADFTYIILDETEAEVYMESEQRLISQGDILAKEFGDLDLNPGKYDLIVQIKTPDAEGEFIINFDVKEGNKIFAYIIFWILGLGALFTLVYFLWPALKGVKARDFWKIKMRKFFSRRLKNEQ